MNKNLLLPHAFKKIGWVLFLPTLLLGLLMAVDGFNGFPSFLRSGPYSESAARIWNNIVLVGILLGVLFICCSRERVEDELIGRIRLNALLAALYLTTGIAVVSTLLLYEVAYLYFMIFNLALLPVLFLVIERTMLWRLRKAVPHEE